MGFVVRAVVPTDAVEGISVMATVAGCTGLAETAAGRSVTMLAGFATNAAAQRFVAMIAPIEATIERPDASVWAIRHPVVVERGSRRLELDVGTSFGDGGHPTTTLALEAIDALGPGGRRRLLDVGCGTGILSIWAAQVGFVATGCDIDPAAVARSRVNARRNGVGRRTRFVVAEPRDLTTEPATPTGFDIGVVNTLIGVHEAHGRTIVGLLGPAASLIVTGVLIEHERRLRDAYAPWRTVRRREREGWLLLTLESG